MHEQILLTFRFRSRAIATLGHSCCAFFDRLPLLLRSLKQAADATVFAGMPCDLMPNWSPVDMRLIRRVLAHGQFIASTASHRSPVKGQCRQDKVQLTCRLHKRLAGSCFMHCASAYACQLLCSIRCSNIITQHPYEDSPSTGSDTSTRQHPHAAHTQVLGAGSQGDRRRAAAGRGTAGSRVRQRRMVHLALQGADPDRSADYLHMHWPGQHNCSGISLPDSASLHDHCRCIVRAVVRRSGQQAAAKVPVQMLASSAL